MVDIRWIGSNNYRAGNFRKQGFILHWMAGYLPGTDSMFRPGGSADIATHYGIGSRDGKGNGLEVHQYVADKDRSYGSYNSDADSRGLSIEIENNYWEGSASKPTMAVHELVAQFIAQKIVEHDMRINGELKAVLGDFPDHRYYEKAIPAFGRDFNVTTHRSMALKDCPGTTDVGWIVRRANEILNGDDMDLNNDRFVNLDGDRITLPMYLNALEENARKDREIIERIERAVTPTNAYGEVVPVGVIASVAERKEDGSRAALGELGTVIGEALNLPKVKERVLAAYDASARPAEKK